MIGRPTRRELLGALAVIAVGGGVGAAIGVGTRSHPAAVAPTAGATPARSATADQPATSATPASTPPATPASELAPEVLAALQSAWGEESLVAAVVDNFAPHADKGSAAVVAAIFDNHHRHLAALEAAAPGWQPSAVPLPTPDANPTAAGLRAQELAASAAVAVLVPQASGDLAGLLASIAAGDAAHAQVLGSVRRASK